MGYKSFKMAPPRVYRAFLNTNYAHNLIGYTVGIYLTIRHATSPSFFNYTS